MSADALMSHEGSPAWAGIDPWRDGREGMNPRFPRVGGDRPKIS